MALLGILTEGVPDPMALKVLLAATLRKYVAGYDPALGCALEVSPGTTVAEVARLLGTPAQEVKLILVDGAAAEWETTLRGHERVAFFPPVGGG